MTKRIRFGLIGAGGIGAWHRAAIEAQEAAGAAQLVAVADPWAARLATQKAELEARGVRWHLDYREMLRLEPDLDAVVIATPIPFHFEMAMACIARGLFVNLEKPPVPLIDQLEELIAADRNARVSVGFQYIGSHCTRLLKELITGGKLGRLTAIRAGGCWPRMDKYYSRATWAGRMMLDGAPVFDGPATNALAHVINGIMYFAGEGRDEFAIPIEVTGELYRARRIESYDTASLQGRFASGVEFSAAMTHATESALPFRIDAHGTKGWARLSNDGARFETSTGDSCDHPETTQQLIDINYAAFLDVINGRRARFPTRLIDVRGYVGATNAMLLSSGGIHDIAPAYIERYMADGDGGFDVLELRDAVEDTISTGRLFSEQGRPWAKAKSKLVRLPLEQPLPFTQFCDALGKVV